MKAYVVFEQLRHEFGVVRCVCSSMKQAMAEVERINKEEGQKWVKIESQETPAWFDRSDDWHFLQIDEHELLGVSDGV